MEDRCDPVADAYNAPMVQTRLGLSGIELMVEAEMPETPPFMYAGIRG